MLQRIEVIKSASKAVLFIACASFDSASLEIKFSHTGTGFLIDNSGMVLTAHHVTKDAQPEEIVFALPSDLAAYINTNSNKIAAQDLWNILKQYELTFVRNDPYSDLALYSSKTLKSSPHLTLSTSFSETVDGEDSVILGYPLGNPFLTSTRAMIAAHIDAPMIGTNTLTKMYKLDGAVNSGNSGGPVINIRTGKVIGIVHAKAGQLSQNLALFKKTEFEGISTGGFGIFGTMREMIKQLEDQIYYGIGFAISSEYATKLLNP